MPKPVRPIHPGEVLLQDFLKPMRLSQYRIARDLHVQPTRINQIIHGKAGISADTALRLGRYFRMSPQFWLNLQAYYDLETTRDRIESRIRREVLEHVAE